MKSSMATFQFGRIDSSPRLVTWSLIGIAVALLSLLIIDAKLVAEYLATLVVAALTACIVVVGLGRLRAPATTKRGLGTGSDPS